MLDDKYNDYNNILIKELRVDWRDIETIYGKLGNTPGIYPDVALLLYETLKRDDVQSFVEIGSGVSTLYLEKAAKKLNKELITYEEKNEWADITHKLLKSFGVSQQISIYDNLTKLPEVDAIFLDCSLEERKVIIEKHKNVFKNCKIFIVDDAQIVKVSVPIIKSFTSMERYNFYTYNPTTREDRHELINFKYNDYEINNWIQPWLRNYKLVGR